MEQKDLIKLFKQRKSKLKSIYKTESKLPLGKRHQMYGALKEIDLFLEVLKFNDFQSL